MAQGGAAQGAARGRRHLAAPRCQAGVTRPPLCVSAFPHGGQAGGRLRGLARGIGVSAHRRLAPSRRPAHMARSHALVPWRGPMHCSTNPVSSLPRAHCWPERHLALWRLSDRTEPAPVAPATMADHKRKRDDTDEVRGPREVQGALRGAGTRISAAQRPPAAVPRAARGSPGRPPGGAPPRSQIDECLDAVEQCAAHAGPETKLAALRDLLVGARGGARTLLQAAVHSPSPPTLARARAPVRCDTHTRHPRRSPSGADFAQR